MASGSLRCRTASLMALRASSSKTRWSASERHGILRLLVCFQHAQLMSLFDAVVHLAPEAQEILRGRYQSADYHQPKEQHPQGFERRMPRSQDDYRHGADLRDHFGLPKRGSLNGEALRRSNIAQAKYRKLAPNDDHHHPRRNKGFPIDAVHINQRNESR